MSEAMRLVRATVSALLVLVLIGGLFSAPAGANVPPEVVERVYPATVKVYLLDDEGAVLGSGSGSILTSTGQILTNFHVVGDTKTGKYYSKDHLVLIWMGTDDRAPAVPMFVGKAVRGDPKLDIALVTVVADLTGAGVAGCLTLPTYTIGDSDQMRIGAEVAVIGYPGVGGNTVNFTSGTISGRDGPWFKTDAAILAGNSGGSAIDVDGKLIGVPTATNYSDPQGDPADYLNLIRPINAARDLLSGVAGLSVPGCDGGTSLGPVPPMGQYGATDVYFAGYVLPDGNGEPIESAPSGTKQIEAYFRYLAVPATTPLTVQPMLNGKPLGAPEKHDTWPYEQGDGGFVVPLGGEGGLGDGTYSVRVDFGDETVTSKPIVIGGTDGGDTAESVTMRGRVMSADTGRPLAGAIFFVLAPGITWDNFDPENAEHIRDIVKTNGKGEFQTNATFPLDEKYSFGVVLKGYEPRLFEGVDLGEVNPSGGFADLGGIELKQK